MKQYGPLVSVIIEMPRAALAGDQPAEIGRSCQNGFATAQAQTMQIPG